MASWDVIVVGAGAAGLFAAARAAERGRRAVLLEKNTKAGVKILMSGGTRCNITQDTDADGIVKAFGKQGRFLRSALSALGPEDVVDLFEKEGVRTKIEPTGKIFPESDRALDVQQALIRRAARAGVQLVLGASVEQIDFNAGTFVVRTEGAEWNAPRLILATGGQSYPGCGTTGDGYAWLRRMGHSIVPPRPALVPITTNEAWVRDLKGVTAVDVGVRVVPRKVLELADDASRVAIARKQALLETRGSVLFTHFGLSGPAVLDVSRAVTGHAEMKSLDLILDLAPDMSFEELDALLAKEASTHGARGISRLAPVDAPQRLLETVITRAGIGLAARGVDITRNARRKLAATFKALAIPVNGTRGFEKAEVTAGGIALSEVDSKTMESKIVPGLFIVGEVLDLDGPIGGYNFQSAFSTGWVAGSCV